MGEVSSSFAASQFKSEQDDRMRTGTMPERRVDQMSCAFRCVRLILAVLAFGATACADEPPNDAYPDDDVRDFPIISTAVTSQTPSWTILPEPMLRIGQVEGETPYLLAGVSFAARLSDGRVVVANGMSSELRYFDPAGRFLRSVGRRGDGPGEFQVFRRVLLLSADTLLVYDSRLRRLSKLAPDGAVAEESSVADIWTMPHDLVAALGDQRYVLALPESSAPDPSPGDTMRSFVHVVISDIGEGSADTIASLSGPLQKAFLLTWPGGSSTIVRPYPFSHEVNVAGGDRRLLVSRTDRYELRVFDQAGAPQMLIRRSDATPTAIDESIVASYLSNPAAVPPPLSDYPDAVETYRSLVSSRRGSTLPTHADVLFDDVNNIWVREPDRWWSPRPANSYAVHAPDGTVAATVEIPAGLAVYYIGSDYIVGRVADELNVQYVVVHELVKR